MRQVTDNEMALETEPEEAIWSMCTLMGIKLARDWEPRMRTNAWRGYWEHPHGKTYVSDPFISKLDCARATLFWVSRIPPTDEVR